MLASVFTLEAWALRLVTANMSLNALLVGKQSPASTKARILSRDGRLHRLR